MKFKDAMLTIDTKKELEKLKQQLAEANARNAKLETFVRFISNSCECNAERCGHGPWFRDKADKLLDSDPQGINALNAIHKLESSLKDLIALVEGELGPLAECCNVLGAYDALENFKKFFGSGT